MNIQFDRHIGDVIVYLQPIKYNRVRWSFPILMGYDEIIRIKVIEKKDKI